MKNKNRFSIYLGLQALTIIIVLGLFRGIEDRKIAATIAGCFFVCVPFFLMLWEYETNKFNKKIWFAATLQFWILFALPILGLRLSHWETDFQQLSILGISGPFLHEWSSRSFLVWMVVTFITSWKLRHSKN